MKKLYLFAAGLLAAASIGVLAQVSGGGVEGGGRIPGGSAFAIQYKSGNNFGGTGPGSAGQVLTSNGAGAAPTFQAAGGGGVTQTVSTQSLNLTGCTTTPTVTISYVVTGSQVTWMPQATTGACTSNAATFGVAAGGLPAAIRPTRAVTWLTQNGTDNGAATGNRCIIINTDGSIIFGATISNGQCDTATWTASGSKNFWTSGQTAYSYPLN